MSDYQSRAINTILENLPLEFLLAALTVVFFLCRDRLRYSRILRQLRDRNHSDQVVTAELVEPIKTKTGQAMVIRELNFCMKLVDILTPEAIKVLSLFSGKSCIRDARIFGQEHNKSNGHTAEMKGVFDLLFRFFKTAMSGISGGAPKWYYCIPTCFKDSTQIKVLRFLVVPKPFMEALAFDNNWWARLEVEKQAHHEHLIALRQIALELRDNNWRIPGVQLLQYNLFTRYTPNPANPPQAINWLTTTAMATLDKVGLPLSKVLIQTKE